MILKHFKAHDLNMFYLKHVRESFRLVVFRYPADELCVLAVREQNALLRACP
jgi:hypothetical protein